MQLLRPGDRGAGVGELRRILAGLGLLRNVDHATEDLFDEPAELAVRAFQQHRGLHVDGLVGPETNAALDAARWRLGDRTLGHYPGGHDGNGPEGNGSDGGGREGSGHDEDQQVGDDVGELQQQLLELGYPLARADGRFSASTAAALKSFQHDIGVTADGVCGPETLRALRQLARRVVGGSPQMLRDWIAVADAGPNLLGKRIVIDPGHGGQDSGVVVGDVCEADLVFNLACRLESRLTAQGVATLMTRARDSSSEDSERAQLANAHAADLVLSLHVDSSQNPLAHGVATFYYGSGQSSSSVGERFADLVQREVVARTGMQDNRIHPKSWTLLLRTSMPTVRVELGYLSSPLDRARLIDATFRDLVAEALSVAVQRLYLPREQDLATGVFRLPALAT